jgi:DNA-binding NarL/FixJ family response regulator
MHSFPFSCARKRLRWKVLVVTAGVSEMESVQLVQSGVTGILDKRHSPEVLVNTIRKVANDEVSLEKSYLKPYFAFSGKTTPAEGQS